MVALPLRPSDPLLAPEAVQLVALVVLHIKVDALLAATLAGFAVSTTVGAGVGAAEVDPPPEQPTNEQKAATSPNKTNFEKFGYIELEPYLKKM